MTYSVCKIKSQNGYKDHIYCKQAYPPTFKILVQCWDSLTNKTSQHFKTLARPSIFKKYLTEWLRILESIRILTISVIR